MLKNFKELNVWQKSYDLCLMIYRITKEYPKEEQYGLVSQLIRVAVSVPSNKLRDMGERQHQIIYAFYILLMDQYVNSILK